MENIVMTNGSFSPVPAPVRSRARGCMLGQLAGDSLGSLVEFLDAAEIRR